MRMMLMTCVLLAMAMAMAMVGCDRGAAESKSEASSDALPANLMLASAPDKPQDVKALKSAAKQGDRVVVRGVIGGRVEPMATNRAIITIIDPAIETCDRMTDHACPTPWDACCVDSDTVIASAATVQVVNDKGQPLKVGLNGHKGLKPLKEVVVVGKVHSTDEKNLVIDATGIYLKG